jgi:hypothetical protein
MTNYIVMSSEVETSLEYSCTPGYAGTVGDSSTSVGMTETEES